MTEEIENCHETWTWVLVPYQEGMHVLGCRWVFRTKFNADGTLDKRRSILVAKGSKKKESITLILSVHWSERLLSKWFFTSPLSCNGMSDNLMSKTRFYTVIYMRRFIWNNQLVLLIKITRIMRKAIYRLKQAPRAWFEKFSTFLLELGFTCSYHDPSMSVCIKGNNVIILLLYVDDMLITWNSSELLQTLLLELNKQFRMKDLGELK